NTQQIAQHHMENMPLKRTPPKNPTTENRELSIRCRTRKSDQPLAPTMINIVVISDTHGHLDPKILTHFKGVEHIIHAGDIGLPWLLLEVESVAAVTAVVGSNDA